MKHSLLALALPLAIGCSQFKKVPVVNMVKDEANQNYRCAPADLPYFYEGSYAAVCLPAEVVKFTVCVERLGLSETGGERQKTTDTAVAVEVPKVDVKGEVAVKTDQRATVTTKFEADGPLAKARALALGQCATFIGAPAPK